MPPKAEHEPRQLDFESIATLVRRRDRDLYWSALFAPTAKRDALRSLYAFHAELEHITAVVSEPMVGQIRLQWWRDAIDLASPDTRTGNPIADALAAAVSQYHLPKGDLLRMIDARLPEIFGEPPPDIDALRDTLFQKWDGIFNLGAAILGHMNETISKAASHAALSYGLTQLLVTVPQQVARKKLLLPPSYFENRGVDLSAVYAGKMSASFGAALADLRGAANRALQKFRSIASEIDEASWGAFLPLTLVKPYLRAMAAADFNPLKTVPSVNPARRFWRIWRAARRRTI